MQSRIAFRLLVNIYRPVAVPTKFKHSLPRRYLNDPLSHTVSGGCASAPVRINTAADAGV